MITKEDERTIEYDYVHAKNHEEQIETLAECYGTDTLRIRTLLAQRGTYKITGKVIEKIKQKMISGIKLGQVHNYVTEVSDCRKREIESILKDWNKKPWDEVDVSEEVPKKEEASEPAKVEEVKKVPTPMILIECAKTRLRDIDVKLDTLLEQLRDVQTNIASLEEEKGELQNWMEAIS